MAVISNGTFGRAGTGGRCDFAGIGLRVGCVRLQRQRIGRRPSANR